MLGAAVLVVASVAGLGAATFQAGEWQVDVAAVADQREIVLGEPAWLSFTITNLSDKSLQILVGGDYQNDFGRPASFTVRAVDSEGRWVTPPEVTPGAAGQIGPRDLPARGSYTFRLFVPHWALFQRPGTYSLVCRRTLQLIRPAPDGVFAKQPVSEVSVEARAVLTVLPRDEKRLKQRIDELGERMIEAGGDKGADEALMALSSINDGRVVPYFVRALAIRSYRQRFIAVQVFGRFATDESIAGLKMALRFQAADFDGQTAQKAGDLAARVRAAAVGALGRMSHPQSAALLLAQQADPAERVRAAVATAARNLAADDARAVLDALASDSSKSVRDAVQRSRTAMAARAAKAATK